MRPAVHGGILLVVAVAIAMTGAAGAAPLGGNETNLTETVSDTVDSTVDDTTVDSTTASTSTDTVSDTTSSTTNSTEGTVNDTSLNGTLLLLDDVVGVTNGTLDATVRTSATAGTPTPTPTPTPAPAAAPPVQTAGGAGDGAAGQRDGDTPASVVAVTSVAAAAGIALGSGPASTTLSGATTAAQHTFDRLLRMLAPFRYSRYDGSDPLEHDDRRRLFEVVEDNPGIYLSATSEAADMPLSTVRHHLRVLEREGMVERAKVRGRRRLFPAHSEAPELAAALEDDATAAVLEALARVGPCSTSELAAEIDRSPSTVSHHLSRLAEDDLVEREQQGRAKVSKLAPVAAEALAEEPPTPTARTPVEAD